MSNTPEEWKTTVTFHEGVRHTFWTEILGRADLPVVSPFPTPMELVGIGPELCYLVDCRALSVEQFSKIVVGLARAFDADPVDVATDIRRDGLPIRGGEDLSVTCRDQEFILSLLEVQAFEPNLKTSDEEEEDEFYSWVYGSEDDDDEDLEGACPW